MADTENEWALTTGSDQEAGMVAREHDERVVAAKSDVGASGRFRQVATRVEVRLDQMRDDFRVRLGLKPTAGHLELVSQLGVVFDDPVEHEVDVVVAADVGVCVGLGDRSVGRAAGVGDGLAPFSLTLVF